MAGIGLKLNRLFEKRTISAYLAGFAYSSMSTVTPMLVVILNILLMSHFLLLFGALYLYLCPADGGSFQFCTLEVHVRCDL